MKPDLLTITIYGVITELVLINYTFKKKHIHHWKFGIILGGSIIPLIITHALRPRYYYLMAIITGLFISITSFLMDYHDFKKWLKKR